MKKKIITLASIVLVITTMLALGFTGKFKMILNAQNTVTPPAYAGGKVAGIWQGSGNTEYTRILQTSKTEYDAYLKNLEDEGFSKIAENEINGNGVENYYQTYQKESCLVHASYITKDQAVVIVTETALAVPNFGVSEENPENVSLTQLEIQAVRGSSQGMGYIYKLSDGSFFIIDGGDKEAGREQAIHTYEVLQQLAGGTVDNAKNIKIAAWLFTHPHDDHILTFCDFLDEYGAIIGTGKTVEIEQLIYNFPKEADILSMCNSDVKVMDDYCYPRFVRLIEQYLPDVDVVKPHSGYKFNFGGITVEILQTYEDWRYLWASIPDLNNASTVFTVTVSGQKTIFLGDSIANYGSTQMYSSEYLAHMYGDYLKADIVQVAHHGLNGGTVDLYKYIDAEYLLLPARKAQYEDVFMNSYENTSSWPAINWAQNVYLRVDEGVKQIFVAAYEDSTLALPYHADASAPKVPSAP